MAAVRYWESLGLAVVERQTWLSDPTPDPNDPSTLVFRVDHGTDGDNPDRTAWVECDAWHSFFVSDGKTREFQRFSYAELWDEVELLLDSEPEPPRRAEFLLWFLPRDQRNDVLGDLSEDYQLVLGRFGKRWANLWYWGKVILEVGPFLREHILTRWLGELIKQFRK
jgi:hypothetical protein